MQNGCNILLSLVEFRLWVVLGFVFVRDELNDCPGL